MALLPKDPKQQKALVAIVLAGGALYAFHTYWYSPRADELEQMESRAVTLEDRNRLARTQAARGGVDLEERNALYERHVMELERLIPQREEVPQLMRTISAEARSAGVNLQALNPELDEPGEFYVKQAWSLNVIGEYDDVGRFMTSIASLPRIITPVDVDIRGYTQPAGVGLAYEAPVAATFRIELYVLPDRGDAPPAAQVGVGG